MGRTRHRALTAALALTLLLSACTTDGEPEPTPTPSATVAVEDSLDPQVEVLGARVADLRATVAALRIALQSAAAGDRGALETARDLLAAQQLVPDTSTESASEGTAAPDDTLAPLLPGPEISRTETVSYGDLLTRTLSAARGAGSTGEPVARFLADPLAGDLGSWQRSPADLLELIESAGATPGLDAAQAGVLDLDGEAPRALAWVLHGIDHPDDASEAAGRALAHLAVIEIALEQLP